mgnify:CR=1 FL=1
MTKTHYPLKLENEFYVTKSGLNKLFTRKKVFVIGYGSLLFDHGWKGRGMDTVTKEEHLIECAVDGYKRGFYGIFNNTHFYGVIADKKQHFNAVLNPIHSFDDWVGLMQTEFIAGMYTAYNYRVVDVTHLIYGTKLPKNAAVHMVANEPKNQFLVDTAHPAAGYYDYVWSGVQGNRSKEFQDEFLKTGGVTHVRRRKRTFKENANGFLP